MNETRTDRCPLCGADNACAMAQAGGDPAACEGCWCRDAASDDGLRGQLKAVASARNLGDIGAPSVIKTWNGKPVLMAKSAVIGARPGFAQLYRTDTYLEVDLDAAAEFS